MAQLNCAARMFSLLVKAQWEAKLSSEKLFSRKKVKEGRVALTNGKILGQLVASNSIYFILYSSLLW